ncbi:glycosyl hydrolase family 61-domain-containing protein [Fomes fomentarius]|nr:glycosyl hydrolase family 61-domain-containing protein [Fomes fomentarius]
MRPHLSSLALSVMPLFGLVACHGSLQTLVANGKSYQGDNPTNPQNLTTPIRLRGDEDVGPVLVATNPALLCGLKAAVAKETALADPGSELSFSWKSGGLEGNWPHEAGPMMAYMTDCQGPCTESQPTMNTPWFMIDEAGLKPGTANDWVQKDIHGGSPYNLVLPKNIKSSEYLLRIEIIALHRASERNGAEFYSRVGSLCGSEDIVEPTFLILCRPNCD